MKVAELSLSHQTLSELVACFTKTRGLWGGGSLSAYMPILSFSSICPGFPSDHLKGECAPISLSQMVLPNFAAKSSLYPFSSAPRTLPPSQ